MDLLPTFAGYADDNASSVPNPAAVRSEYNIKKIEY